MATPLGSKAVSALGAQSSDALPSPAHPTSVLVVSDKKAKEDAAAWGDALHDALAGRKVSIVPVVDASHLPKPLVPFVSVYLSAVGANEAVVDKAGWTETEEGYQRGRVMLMVVGGQGGQGEGEPSVVWRKKCGGGRAERPG
eukprot:TRINITY_DN821_c0_g1_i1.p3 TRINITY_DN821_c0_g1~~TRINITY_DN821_c0_g1_i1.p3  ORF type:complete len:142 (+),score=40.63 TRINITY_DN821_c0_g1_i1:631-1056(+)